MRMFSLETQSQPHNCTGQLLASTDWSLEWVQEALSVLVELSGCLSVVTKKHKGSTFGPKL